MEVVDFIEGLFPTDDLAQDRAHQAGGGYRRPLVEIHPTLEPDTTHKIDKFRLGRSSHSTSFISVEKGKSNPIDAYLACCV
jgi:hypothetical protein